MYMSPTHTVITFNYIIYIQFIPSIYRLYYYCIIIQYILRKKEYVKKNIFVKKCFQKSHLCICVTPS